MTTAADCIREARALNQARQDAALEPYVRAGRKAAALEAYRNQEQARKVWRAGLAAAHEARPGRACRETVGLVTEYLEAAAIFRRFTRAERNQARNDYRNGRAVS